jgi:hypothetical protein
LGTLAVGRRSTQVFARPEQKEETRDEALRRGVSRRGVLELSQGPHLGDNRKGQRLDAAGRVIGAAPSAIHGSEANVKVAMAVQTRVRGPQLGIRLTHRSYGVLHCPRADRVVAGSDCSGAISLCKQLEEREGVPGAKVPGVQLQARAENLPQAPACVGRGAASARNPASGHFLQSAPVKAELVAVGRGCSVQERARG